MSSPRPHLVLLALLLTLLGGPLIALELTWPELAFRVTLAQDATLESVGGFYDVKAATRSGTPKGSYGRPFDAIVRSPSPGTWVAILGAEKAVSAHDRELFVTFTPFAPRLHWSCLFLDLTFRKEQDTFQTRVLVTWVTPGAPVTPQTGIDEMRKAAIRLLDGLVINLDENEEMRKNRLWNATIGAWVPTGPWRKNGVELQFAGDLPR